MKFYIGYLSLAVRRKNFLILKNKKASYFTNRMSLFENTLGIAAWDKQIMANHRQVQRREEKVLLLQGKGRSCVELFCCILVGLLLGKEKSFLPPAAVC